MHRLRPALLLTIALFMLLAQAPASVGGVAQDPEPIDCDTVFDHDLAQMLLNTNTTGDFVEQFDPDGNGIACDHDGPPDTDGRAELTQDDETLVVVSESQLGAVQQEQGQAPSQASNQNPATAPETCANFDAWEWAQLVYDSDPQQHAGLDASGDGVACPELPRGVGFAPAYWTDAIPEDVEEVQLFRIIDGDTFEVLIDGVSNRVRIYRADTPETQNEVHCGGAEATAFAEYALSLNDNGDVLYLERDRNARDRYGRELAYVWFEVDGLPYMLNHILITNGWAEDIDYGDRLYDEQFQEAAAFAETHQLGVYELCGAFNLNFTDTQSAPVAQEPAAEQPAEPAVEQPAAPVVDEPAQGAGCDANYIPCIPAYPPDLNCADIGHRVQVIGSDPHGLDRDNDGIGCESY